MSQNLETLHSQAEQLCESGRLLWLLGQGLAQASLGNKELGPWALRALKDLRSLEQTAPPAKRQTKKVLSRTPKPPSGGPKWGTPIVVWIASCSRAGQQTVLAVGADTAGHKRVLSVREGSTSNPATCESLLDDLDVHEIEKDGTILLVTDGSLALDDTFQLRWERPIIAHCHSAVRKSVLGHLQGLQREETAQRLKRSWDRGLAAEGALRALVADLAREHPGAADRLERSLKATLTVDLLGVASPLREHLVLAGPARVAFEKAVQMGGSDREAMKAGLADWLQRTRRIQGYRQLPELVKQLHRYANGKSEEKEQAASQCPSSKTQPTQ
ncbi:MAG: hypothetical protein WC423_24925 [Vulcanimicrobiota bacterium]